MRIQVAFLQPISRYGVSLGPLASSVAHQCPFFSETTVAADTVCGMSAPCAGGLDVGMRPRTWWLDGIEGWKRSGFDLNASNNLPRILSAHTNFTGFPPLPRVVEILSPRPLFLGLFSLILKSSRKPCDPSPTLNPPINVINIICAQLICRRNLKPE